MLAKLPKAVRSEMDLSRSIIEAGLGIRPEHLSYRSVTGPRAGPREFEIAAETWFQDRSDNTARCAVCRVRGI